MHQHEELLLAFEQAVSPEDLLFVDFLRFGKIGENVEVVGHDAPCDQLYAAELGCAEDHAKKVVSHLVGHEVDSMGDAAHQVVVGAVGLDSVVGG